MKIQAPFFAFLVTLVFVAPSLGQQFTIELDVNGQRIEGTPLAWSNRSVELLSRDGQVWSFHPSKASNYRRTADGFSSYSQNEMRSQLFREFGSGFKISGTAHYLVVHPPGTGNHWSSRFEQLYRSFIHYFTARGLQPARPQFPLVAVVFPDEARFLQHARTQKVTLPPDTLGYYSQLSNRILLYDVTAGKAADDPTWHLNAETIIHEAAHQTAFNTGIHSRYAPPPRWVAEGLGTLFESKGVWNSTQYRHQSDRINRYQLDAFRRYAARWPKGSLSQLIASDRMFQTNPDAAYAASWALTFFLAETRPQQYLQYLRSTASRRQFTAHRSPEMLREFTDVFGTDVAMLEAQFLRYMSTFK